MTCTVTEEMFVHCRNLILVVLLFTLFCLAGCAAMQSLFAAKVDAEGPHAGAAEMTPEQCFACHREGVDGAPVAPESMYGRTNCQRCHVSD